MPFSNILSLPINNDDDDDEEEEKEEEEVVEVHKALEACPIKQ